VLGQDAQSGALTRAGIAERQSEAAFADLLFDAPAEAPRLMARSIRPPWALRVRRD